MKNKPPKEIEKYRIKKGRVGSIAEFKNNGQFEIPSCISGRNLLIQISDGQGWDHVSVSAWSGHKKKRARIPTWKEMCYVKNLFFEPDEVVIQYHPAEKNYINMAKTVVEKEFPEGTPEEEKKFLLGIAEYILARDK